PGFRVPWGWRESRFLVHSAGLALLTALPLLAGPFLAQGAGSADVLALLGLTVLAGYVLARLSPALPAASDGHPAAWPGIWRLTRGNGARLFLAALLAVAPWSIIQLSLL